MSTGASLRYTSELTAMFAQCSWCCCVQFLLCYCSAFVLLKSCPGSFVVSRTTAHVYQVFRLEMSLICVLYRR